MKKIFSFLLSLLLLLSVPMAAGANYEDFSIGQTFDDSILAGGIYDMYAWVGDDADNYTYQWQVDLGFGKGHWSDLEDNADPYGYSGTNTYHMQFISAFGNGNIIGTGWEDIPFQCVVTNKKTGVSKTTASIYIKIFSSDDLPEYLKEQGFGLYEPTIQGATGLRTTDYIIYTASADAGKQLKLFTGCWRPNGEHLLRRSNFTENVEVWITEGGKTVKTDNSATYTPYTIGKNAVTVQFKLRYALGIHDLGYYETKTVHITTEEPAAVDFGTAKYQLSLLKERYNESQKLTTIPKGAEFKVTEKTAGWCQVVFNGYVGYVATSAITLAGKNPTIEHVNVTITEPLAGNLPATSCTVTPDTCSVTYVDWYNKTDSHFMEPGERFQKGHTYQLVVWASAEENCSFKLDDNDNMLATATINGNLPAFTSRAYEQIIGKVIEIRYDFVNVKEAEEIHVCKPTLVARVEPTCTSSGFEAYYYCQCGMQYSDPQGKNVVDTGTWGKIPPLGHLETPYQSDSNMHYKLCGRPNCSQELSGSRGYHTGGSATCQQYAVCTVCGEEYGEKTDHKWTKNYVYQEKNGHAHVCEYPSCTVHDALTPHIPGPEATETQPQKCTVCEYILVPAGNHTHNLTKVDAVSAACLTPGSQAYYTCSGCSDWFWDEAGNKQISDKNDVVLEPLGHFAEQWQSDEESHWQACTVCLTKFAGEKHLDNDHDQKCDVCNRETDASSITTEPQPTEKDEETPGRQDEPKAPAETVDWYLWVLIFFVIFAASLTTTVIILKKKNRTQ